MRKFFLITAMAAMLVAAPGCGKTSTDSGDAADDGVDNGEFKEDVMADVVPDEEDDAAPDTAPDPVEDMVEETPAEIVEDIVEDIETEPELPGLCPMEGDLGPGDHKIDISFDGRDRSYDVHVPGSYNSSTPMPLFINMHGFSSNGWQQVLFSGMNAGADLKGYIAIYPYGIGNSWNGGTCCGTAASEDIDDVGFMKAIVEDISTKLCVHPRHVYATGMSNGGYMSHRLGCEAGDVFAGVAPVAGAMGIDDCSPDRPMPILIFHGTEDGLVAYEEGRAAFEDWVEHNGCTEFFEIVEFGESWCEIYEDCEDGVKTAMCSLNPMGHCWPGGSSALCFFAIGPYNDDIIAHEYMFDFLMEFVLP